ncbi:hypothetical protein [Pedobacter sp. UBA4863]|uniref:hypothetical protein n=1 Tax=Pedobacter sp. UBA4863 TaxID=1947060 RepID=UPI0025FC9C05|nr:hypothetical protein [Pedobacter sp. UBA4863]
MILIGDLEEYKLNLMEDLRPNLDFYKRLLENIKKFTSVDLIDLNNNDRDKLIKTVQFSLNRLFKFLPLQCENIKGRTILRCRKEDVNKPYESLADLSYNKHYPEKIKITRLGIDCEALFYGTFRKRRDLYNLVENIGKCFYEVKHQDTFNVEEDVYFNCGEWNVLKNINCICLYDFDNVIDELKYVIGQFDFAIDLISDFYKLINYNMMKVEDSGDSRYYIFGNMIRLACDDYFKNNVKEKIEIGGFTYLSVQNYGDVLNTCIFPKFIENGEIQFKKAYRLHSILGHADNKIVFSMDKIGYPFDNGNLKWMDANFVASLMVEGL